MLRYIIGILTLAGLTSLQAEEQFSPRLSLQDALYIALEGNTDIQIERLTPLVAEQIVQQRLGIFDPRFEVSYDYRNLSRQQNTQEFISSGGGRLEGTPRIFDENAHFFSAGLISLLEFGTRVEVGVTANRISNSIIRQDSSTFNLFDPEYRTFMGLKLRQPLLQGFGRDVTTAQIRIARKSREIEDARLKAVVVNTARLVSSAYYDLLFSHDQLRIREEELSTLKTLAEDQQRQVERGLLSSRQYGAVLAEMAEVEEQYLRASITFSNIQVEVMRLLGRLSGNPTETLFTPDRALTDDFPAINLNDTQLFSIENRPDYLEALLELERAEIEVDYARNLRQPNLDLTGSFGVSGLDREMGKSFGRAFSDSYVDWGVGVVFSIPWGNIEANARHQEAVLRKNRANSSIHHAQNRASAEIRTAIETVRILQNQVDSLSQFRSHFENEMEEENIRLERGETSPLQMTQLRRDLADARIREKAAVVLLHQSYLHLMAANGSLLDHFGLQFEP